MIVTYLPSTLPSLITARELYDLGFNVQARMLYWTGRSYDADRFEGGIWEFRDRTAAGYRGEYLKHVDSPSWFGVNVIHKPLSEMAFELI